MELAEFKKTKFAEFLEYFEDEMPLQDRRVLWGYISTSIIDELFPTGQSEVNVEAVVMPNEVVGGGQWLELKDYLPIDVKKVRTKWESIYNIPTDEWIKIECDLNMLNNDSVPNTAKIFTLNHLPFCVIKILNESRREA
jgi:hypothetical protein